MKLSICVLFTALIATGCASEVPLQSSAPFSSQQILKSAHHWDIIAKDTAQQSVVELAKQGLEHTPVTITTPQSDAPFQAGFRNFLITHLVKLNQPVSRQQAEIEVQFETQLIRHHSPRQAHDIRNDALPLVAGLLVVHNAALNWGTNSLRQGALAWAGASDLLRTYETSPPQTEVIVTTSVMRKGQFLMRKTDVYYIEDEDGALFEQMKQLKEWRVMG